MKRQLFLALALFAALQPPPAHADAENRHGFSQLDFDRPGQAVASRAPSSDQIKEILADPAPETQKAPAAIAPDATSRARLADPKPKTEAKVAVKGALLTKFDWVKPEEGDSHYLVPRLKGPDVDDRGLTITTHASWKKDGAACQDVTTAASVCAKAKALKELMQRFSGSDDFFAAQCNQSCPNPGERPVLVGFAVAKVPEGDFRMAEEGKVCRYQIVSNVEPPKWQMLQGERGTCQCLSAECSLE